MTVAWQSQLLYIQSNAGPRTLLPRRPLDLAPCSIAKGFDSLVGVLLHDSGQGSPAHGNTVLESAQLCHCSK
jgi:hypothetical protein